MGFSDEVAKAHESIFGDGADDRKRVAVVREWLQRHQPCLFGRIAAKNDFLAYCVLNESDLVGSDDAIQNKIQAARLEWSRSAFDGAKSGFIIMCFSEDLATAKPSDAVKALACRLASLYLLTEIVPDQVFVDEIWLEKPGREPTTWKWSAGVNYFSSHGDRRWWQDHRFPGGIAFSINSVGHMVKSGILAKSMKDLEIALGAPAEGWETSKIDSLSKALEMAMRTIHMAADGVSGKAMRLLDAPADAIGEPIAWPLKDLPSFLADKSQSQYFGHYHTDYTVPSEYFLPDVERPTGLQGHVLDFTYLSTDSIDNPDHITMGTGRPIRVDDEETTLAPSRQRKSEAIEVPIGSEGRLLDALKQRAPST